MFPSLHQLSLNSKSSVSTDTFYVRIDHGPLNGYTLTYENPGGNMSPPPKRAGVANNTVMPNARLVSARNAEHWILYKGEQGSERKTEMHVLGNGSIVKFHGPRGNEAKSLVVMANGDELYFEGPKGDESRVGFKSADGTFVKFKGHKPDEMIEYVQTPDGKKTYFDDDVPLWSFQGQNQNQN